MELGPRVGLLGVETTAVPLFEAISTACVPCLNHREQSFPAGQMPAGKRCVSVAYQLGRLE
ncbi:hypothetical protein [Streptomyces sp. NPDC057460]|uniref:hypothetical protein n=1 Tax=Streptomyces sp. NPDC057460 TaxID=3346141 RepID=UPI0036A2FB92